MHSRAVERILGSLSRSLASAGDLESLAQRGLSALTNALGAQGAWLRLRENGLRLRAAVGVVPPEEARLTPQEVETLSSGRVLIYRLPEEATGPASRHWAGLGYRGLVLAPLRGDGVLLGTLGLLFAEVVPYEEIVALEEVLPLFGLILQRAHAEAELARRQQLLEALHRLDRAMLEGKNLEEVAQIGAEEARSLLRAKAATVSLVEGPERRLVAASGQEVEPLRGQSASLEEGPHAQALRTGEPVVLMEIPGEGVPPWLLALAPLGNALVLPLKPDGSTLGFLGLYGLSNPPAILPMAQAFAAQLSLALLRELDQEALQRRVKEQELLLRALEALGEVHSPEEAARRLVELAPELVWADWVAVLLLEDGVLRVAAASGALAGSVGQGLPQGRGVSWAALREGTQVLRDVQKDPRIYTPPGVDSPPSGSEVVARLPNPHGGALGVLIAGRIAPTYSSQEARLVEALAQAGATAMERARHDLAERRVRAALERLIQVPPGDLEALVRALGESLGVRWAFLDRLLSPDKALAVAVYGAEPFEYDLEGTPCADVFAGQFCEYGQEVTRLFPHDRLAAEMGAEAYLGTPLRGEGGRILGILVAMHDAPLPEGEKELRREILLAYAQRAALELTQRENQVRLEATARAHSLLRPAHAVQEVFEIAVEAALRETRATTALLSLYREEGDCLEVVAAAGYIAEAARGRRVERGVGLAWRVLEGGESLYLEDASQVPEALFFSGRRDRAAYLGVPLRAAEGRVLGVLSADTAEHGGELFPEDRHFLLALAEATGAAIARLEALRKAQGEAERFRALAELSARLEVLDDPEVILEEALEALWRISGFQAAFFSEAAPEGLRLKVVAGEPPGAWLERARQESYPPGRGLMGQALLTGEALYTPFYPDHPQALPERVALGLKSAAYMPVKLFGRTVGVLSLLDFREAYREDPLPLLTFAARRLERALEKAQTLQQLRQAREEALKGLGVALEYRDLETAGHTERVTRLALRLAEALGLGEPALTELRLGAYLHDLGKLAVPDAILKKPGKLTPEEWEQMKAHVTLGEEMARRLGFLPPATLEVIRHHHERWDGKGYPDGLAGEAIPLLARIFALADVYDALTSERPYKPPWSHEEALAELERQAGRQFDPQLAQVFVRQLRQGRGG
ncbi:GAF domain-containing protein [Calidithermus timidus]|jgi:putative nucleotidyltransferase with HDIG domain|uniref:GAF domain-containing protein n=1 Tax=Calidithermus timidus TaxID=307124 RepID=UPI0003667BDA|nr:GAF domain-containing protein [Calidithermus timidus]